MWRPGERRAVGPMTASLSFARPVVPTSGEGRGIFRPRARYFPWMESTQRSSGLRARTRGVRLGRAPNLFGAGMNLGPLRPPPAAARIYQIHVSPLFPLAPLVCLAFPALFGRGRPMWRPGSVGRDDSARRVVTITPPHPSSPTAMPPSPLGGEGLTGGQRPPLRYVVLVVSRRARRPGAPPNVGRMGTFAPTASASMFHVKHGRALYSLFPGILLKAAPRNSASRSGEARRCNCAVLP